MSVMRVRPTEAVLGAKCAGCHSDVLAENRLRLDDVPSMLKGGKRGPALVPGKADASLLFTMAAHRVACRRQERAVDTDALLEEHPHAPWVCRQRRRLGGRGRAGAR